MGRTDLARFRKTAPSVTPPAIFPEHVRYILQHVDTHPLHRATRAIRSLNDSTSQSGQVASVKVLGVVLYEVHNQFSNPHACTTHTPQSPTSPSTDSSLSPCQLIVPVLLAFLFDASDAMPGLISASLRAILRVAQSQLPLIQSELASFFHNLENTSVCTTTSCSKEIEIFRQNPLPSSFCCRISTVAILLTEPESKNWIFEHSKRVYAVLSLACYITDLFISTNSSQSSTQSRNQSVNTTLMLGACDSAMKTVNDIVNAFHTGEILLALSGELKQIVIRAIDCCHRLLQLPSTPRSCSLACAVTLVTGHILLNCPQRADTEQLTKSLQADILLKVTSTYPPFSQLSIIRGLMEAPIAKPALPKLLFPPSTKNVEEVQSDKSTIFGVLASLTSTSSDVHFRYLAMETVISCVRRVAPSKLSDGCRDAVLSLVYQRWEEPFSGVSTQIRDTMNALVSVDGSDEGARMFWTEMTSILVKGDWRCKGMYAPMCVLVNRIGASTVMMLEQKCQTLSMQAMAADSRIIKSVSDWLDALWTTMKRECNGDYKKFVSMTAEPVIEALLNDENSVLRERVAEHVLPVYMHAPDKLSVAEVGQSLLTWLSNEDLEQQRDHQRRRRRASRVRGSIMVMAVARKKGISLSNFSDPVVLKLLQDALNSGEEDLRTSAFDLVVTSSIPTEPITQSELDLVLSFLPIALMPGGAPADRSRFRHGMRRFFERFAMCRRAAQEASGGWWTRQRKNLYGGTHSLELEEERVALLDRLNRFEKKCVSALMACAYPGASFARRTSAMEVIKLLVVNLGSKALLGGYGRSSHDDDTDAVGTSSVAALIAGLVDEWERPRRASLEVVQSLVAPLPGLSSIEEARALLRYARPLLDSARQSDVDSGASICRVIFQKFVMLPSVPQHVANGNINLQINWEGEEGLSFGNGICRIVSGTQTSPALMYAMRILDSVEELIMLAECDFTTACARGLFHGRFLLLRYVVQDFPWKSHMNIKLIESLNHFIQRFVRLSDKSARIALEGVSFQNFNAGVLSGAEETVGDADDDPIFLKQGRQLESTSCFLSAKEICVSLGVLCHQAPLHDSIPATVKSEDTWFLDQSNIESIGELYIAVFTGTRHWGVIDGASEGLQLLCERLLSSSSMSLRALPEQWAMDILSRALGGELYVLRRSAGIPWLMNAVVNSEASVNRRSHESPMLNRITNTLLDHMRSANQNERSETITGKKGKLKDEESMSHALNLLRALFLNSNIGSNVLKHLESATICCIDAFCSSSWLVRNSAMMLYSALIRRGVGVCRERKGEDSSFSSSSFKAAGGTSATLEGTRRLNGTTAFQFFSRHPKLYPFLLQHLNRAVENNNSDDKGGDHPVLYPTLYLLSCISPNTNEDPSTQMSMAKFWDVVRTCVHWRTDYVRRAAAAACVALIDDCTQTPAIIREIMSGLPEEPTNLCLQKVKDWEMRSDNMKENDATMKSLEQNWLHGELLTVIAVLRNAAGVMSGPDKKKMVSVITAFLPRVAWIATNGRKNVCSVTRGCMVDIITLSYEFAIECIDEKLLNTCENIAEKLVVVESWQNGALSQIGLPAFRIKAVRLYGDTVMQKYNSGGCTLNDAMKSLCACMDCDHDVEEGIVGCMEICSSLLSNVVVDHLVDQKSMHEVCERLWVIIERILRGSEPQRSETVVAALTLWVRLLDFRDTHFCQMSRVELGEAFKLAEQDGCVDVQERALVVISLLVDSIGIGCDEEIGLRWMDLVVKGSQSHAPSMRMAACMSLFKRRNVDTLNRGGGNAMMKEVIAQGYITLGHLLEDDSVDVRKLALKTAQMCLSLDTKSEELDGHVLPTMMRIHFMLSESYGDCVTLFGQFDQFLRVEMGSDSDDKLMGVVSRLVGVHDKKSELRTRWTRQETYVGDDGDVTVNGEPHRTDDGRLFRLEDVCGDAEVVLQMQLLTWNYIHILHRRGRFKYLNHQSISTCDGPLQEAISIVVLLVHDLESIINNLCTSRYSTDNKTDANNAMGGGMFATDGFVRTVRANLRILLGLQCVFSIGVEQNRHEFEVIREGLQSVMDQWGFQMHPVIKSNVQVLLDIAMGKHDVCNNGEILFLLPMDDFPIHK